MHPSRDSRFRLTLRQWILLAAVVAGALSLRVHDLSHIFLWTDETGFNQGPGYFNEHVYSNPPMPLVEFAWQLNKQDVRSTNTWGWPAVVWLTCRIFGATLGVARVPSALIDTAAVLFVFFLAYGIVPFTWAGRRFLPAIAAAIIAALSIPQLEFSQRVIPYVSVTCMAAALLLAHMNLWRRIAELPLSERGLNLAVALYTAAASLCLCMHPSLSLLLAISMVFIIINVIAGLRKRTPAERRKLFTLAAWATPVLVGAILLNSKGPRAGYHLVLAPYYHRVSLASIPKLAFHAYDLAAYHLNLFYNPSLYFPDRLNPVLLPLFIICLLGFVFAAMGRFGDNARHLARLGMAAIAMDAALSVGRLHMFPFGGVRQTLFLSPFLFVFTGLGFGALRANRVTRAAGVVTVALYLALWAISLPRFYSDRLESYNTQDLVSVWRANDELPLYVNDYSWGEVRYALREHPEIPISGPYHPPSLMTSYLLVSTHAPLGDNYWLPALKEYYSLNGITVTKIVDKPAKYPQDPECGLGCIYAPPSGLWIYRIEGSRGKPDAEVQYHDLFMKLVKFF